MNRKYNYNGLWKKLIDLNMTKTDLRLTIKLSTATLAKLGKGEPVSLESLDKICKYLNCNLGDIVEIYYNTQEDKGDNND